MTRQAPLLLVVDDDAAIRRAIATELSAAGFVTVEAADGEEALARFREVEPDLVLTDLAMPRRDGLSLVRELRRTSSTPIVVLSVRGEEEDKVRALDAGADDYLTKPFSMRELVARVQALLRRVEAMAGATTARQISLDDDIDIDIDARRVRQSGEVVHLTPTEFDLLVCLAERPGRILTRERLLVDVWGYRDGSGARTVDSHVRALRRKLGDGVVRTVHGVGYGLGEGDDEDADAAPEGR